MTPRSRIPLLASLLGLVVLGLALLWGQAPGPAEDEPPGDGVGDGGADPALVASTDVDGQPPVGEGASGSSPLVEIPPWPLGEIDDTGPATGLVYVKLIDAAGQPLPRHPIEVDWWKAFDVRGSDSGTTDELGRFRTGANEAWEIDSVSIPRPGKEVPHVYHSGGFAASPDSPHEVLIELPPTCLIRGRVVDLAGAPQADVKVECEIRRTLPLNPFVHRLGADEVRAVTGADGAFMLHVLAGHFTVTAKAGTRPPTCHAEVHLTAARRVVDLTLPLAVGGGGRTVRVTLMGPEGKPPKARVRAFTDAEVFGVPEAADGVRYETTRYFKTGRAQGDGTYVFRDVVGHPWMVSAKVPGMRYTRVPLVEDGAELRIELEAEEAKETRPSTRTIEVVARLPDGTLAKPSVQVYESGGWEYSSSRGAGTPIALYLKRKKRIHILAREGEYAVTGVGPIDPATAPERVEVVMQPGKTAHVEVRDPTGKPVGVEVVLRASWSVFQPLGDEAPQEGFVPRPFDLHRAEVEDGKARFSGLASVPYLVIATPTDRSLPPARGVVRGGETLKLTLGSGLEGRVTVRGRIVDNESGAPIIGVPVDAWTEESWGEATSAQAVTDAQGRFTLRGLPAQPARVDLKVKGYAWPQRREFDLRKPQEMLEFRMERARRLPLQVVDTSGAPVKRAVVFARWPTGEQVVLQDQYGNWEADALETDRNGRVDLLGLPAVRVSLTLHGPDGTEDQARVHELDLRDPPLGLVRLVLRDE